MVTPVYVPRRVSRSRYTQVRGVRYHLREWGPADAPTLICLHGGRDTSASFQFVVDALAGEWHVIAPDWRGHGLTQATPGSYWLSDFICDLDHLFPELAPSGRAPVLGHSMGGNVATAYAGLRPDAVTHVVTLDALGNPMDRSPVKMLELLTNMLDDSQRTPRRRTHASVEEMAERLVQVNPRLDLARARFLVTTNAQPQADGGLTWPHDPTFRGSLPTFHTAEEWGECWRNITAPALCILASAPKPNSATRDAVAVPARASYFRNIKVITAPNTGHNVHQEAPELVAEALESFVRNA